MSGRKKRSVRLAGGVGDRRHGLPVNRNMEKLPVGAASAGDSRYSIPVDESIEKMTVTVSTTRQNTEGGHFLALVSHSSLYSYPVTRSLCV